MAKAIYAINVWKFGKQLKLTTKEDKGLLDVPVFVSSMYVKARFHPTPPASAPGVDLKFLKDLKNYDGVEKKYFNSCLHKILWSSVIFGRRTGRTCVV